jgi:serine/threonine protein kinase
VQIVVWKELNYGKMSEKEKQMLVSEVNILRELRHPNIVRYYDRIINRETTKIYIVMEYCESVAAACATAVALSLRPFLSPRGQVCAE